MRIILCSANFNEISRIINKLKPVLLYTIKNKYKIFKYSKNDNVFYFIITGMGYKNIKKNLDFFIDKYKLDNTYKWIFTGYMGSLSNQSNIGEIYIPVIVRDDNCKYKIKTVSKLQNSGGITLFSVNKIYSKNDKEKLKEKYPEVQLIDMESSGFCEVMKNRRISDYFIYKSITDNLDFKFPDFRLLRDSIFKIPLKILFTVIFKDIKQIKYLIQIYFNMYKASSIIYKFFIELIKNR